MRHREVVPTPAPEPDPFVKRLVLVEQVKRQKGKRLIVLRLVHGELKAAPVLEQDKSVFEGKDVRSWHAGQVYEAEVILREGGGPSSIRLDTAKYAGLWPDEGHRTALRAMEHAAEVQARAEKMQERESDTLKALEALDPLRALYKRQDFYGRAALEATLLTYLRMGS